MVFHDVYGLAVGASVSNDFLHDFCRADRDTTSALYTIRVQIARIVSS